MSDLPIGTVVAYTGTSAPSGWLICNGASLERASYADLFSAIGTAFGSVDGDHFNIPDTRGKIIAGKGAGTGYTTLGATGGAKIVNIAHSHTANNHTHTASGTTGGGSTYNTLGGDNGSTMPTRAHTHPWSITTGNQSDTGSDTQLSETQSILNPYIVKNWIIKI